MPLIEYLTGDLENIVVSALGDVIAVFLNIAADYMLINRCYVIWSSKKRVAIPLITASVITNAIGLAGVITIAIASRDTFVESNQVLYLAGSNIAFAFSIISAFVNSVITLLTAGRIWWIYRKARNHGVNANDNLVQAVSRIIFESGILYPICIVASLIALNTKPQNQVAFDFYPVAVLSAGIAPTLIMVRAKLGKNVESMQDVVSDIRFTSRPAPREESDVQIRSIGDLQGEELEVPKILISDKV
uniref:Uncharacterized protein n=1 Tax=Moniliophthora roreri TaxID=221103 RepID=A0A0W0G6G9_MONRR